MKIFNYQSNRKLLDDVIWCKKNLWTKSVKNPKEA